MKQNRIAKSMPDYDVAYLSTAAQRTLGDLAQTGARAYSRDRMIPRLLPLTLAALPVGELKATTYLILALTRAMRAERARAGHWTYDLNRHIGLNQALRSEKARLIELSHTHNLGP